MARVRRLGLDRLREQIAIAFGDDPDSPVTIQLARIALAAFDGAFLASQADPAVTLEEFLEPLAAAVIAAAARCWPKRARTRCCRHSCRRR